MEATPGQADGGVGFTDRGLNDIGLWAGAFERCFQWSGFCCPMQIVGDTA